jgi:hypothetical protein
LIECAGCDNLNSLGFCEKCGCYVAAKIRDPKQVCPISKW